MYLSRACPDAILTLGAEGDAKTAFSYADDIKLITDSEESL